MTSDSDYFRTGYYDYLKFAMASIPILMRTHKDWMEKNFNNILEDYYEFMKEEEGN